MGAGQQEKLPLKKWIHSRGQVKITWLNNSDTVVTFECLQQKLAC